jgi:hypothetical protein
LDIKLQEYQNIIDVFEDSTKNFDYKKLRIKISEKEA